MLPIGHVNLLQLIDAAPSLVFINSKSACACDTATKNYDTYLRRLLISVVSPQTPYFAAMRKYNIYTYSDKGTVLSKRTVNGTPCACSVYQQL